MAEHSSYPLIQIMLLSIREPLILATMAIWNKTMILKLGAKIKSWQSTCMEVE